MCYHVLECIILFKALSLLIAQAKLYTSNYLNVYDMLNVSEYIQQHWNVQLKSEHWLLLSWIWLPLTSTAHHPWTTSPIMHCTHTFPSTITPITQLSPFTHQPWLPHHTCTSFTHSHKSSTQTLTQCEVLFFPWLTFPSVFPSLSSRVLPGLLTPSPDCLLPASLTLPAFW